MKITQFCSCIALALALGLGLASTSFAGEGDNVQKANDDKRKIGSTTKDKDGNTWTLVHMTTAYGTDKAYFDPDGSGKGGTVRTEIECPCEIK